ncbi:nuclease SbcCD subunit C [Halolactibacillus miurensis]|uniref:Nuclease SbcCD subunit C n=1 Tax=Halolactibacillus miurensis TaxID=306541 RepID=A0A1I6SYZ6_9BACI|nr:MULTISPECIES: AAA family ATPase [Halolactibacillus]GEM04268.1 nuclease SbcCD subunit C [Halolactibacillus miurensis]SFS82073.1 exonuclease SbcC [Halolactibacillus miurensis]
MRTLFLEFQAFGPYKHKQTLDFTELGEESLFLITGPTGAGKTTIFDAICFSLYGKASGTDRDHDTLRSDFSSHDTDTFVRFTFSVGDETYRVLRKPKQWIPKLRGEGLKEEPATAVLETCIDGAFVVTESKINEVNDKIKRVLGLDYDQFLKMIMIPQGEFRRLISENSQEREQILQKLFQTAKYAELQDYFKDKAKEQAQQLADLQQRLQFEWQRIPWDSEVEVDQLTTTQLIERLETKMRETKQHIQHNETKQTELKQSMDQKNRALQHQTHLLEAFSDYETKQQELAVLLEKEPEITKKRQTLEAAEKAATLDYYYQDYQSRKQEVQNKSTERDTVLKKVANVTQAFHEQQAEFDRLHKQVDTFDSVKDDLKAAKQQREDWLTYEKKTDSLIEQGNHLRTLTETYEEKQATLSTLATAIKEKEVILNARHEMEASYLKVLNEQEKQETVLKKLSEAKTATQTLAQLRKTYKDEQTQLQSFETAVEKAKQKETETDKRWRDGYANRLKEALSSGEPCPVCGSKEHPGARHTQVALVSDAVLQAAKTDREQKEQALRQKQAELAELKLKGTYQREKVDGLLKDVSKDNASTSDVSALQEWIDEREAQLTDVKKEVKHYEEQKRRLSELGTTLEKETKQYSNLEAELNALMDTIVKEKETVQKLETECELLKQRLPIAEMTFRQFEAQFKDKQTKLKTFEIEYEQADKKRRQLETDKQTLETELNSLTRYLTELREKETDRQAAFQQQLIDSAFHSEADFLTARQPADVRETLKREIQTFDEARQTLAVHINTLTDRINDQEKPDIAPLKAELSVLDERYNTLVKETTRLEELFELMAQVRKKVNQQLDTIKQAEQQYQTIKKLADLSRGENHLKLSFERFVLSSFLDDILVKANQRLVELTDYRYQLRRSHEIAKRGAQSGLDLEVIDHHTSKVRSVKTLSGGEGFKASLSLALGMADVVQAYSGGIQLDTLFIDEGFGTLDDISLEQAINTLKGLSQKNRILGIISHVPQLKEEIYAKLDITTSPNGSDAAFSF